MKTISSKICLFIASILIALPAQAQQHNFSSDDYTKSQHDIEMKDGVKLHAVVYAPKDKSEEYPIILKRTPYSCRPYENGKIPEQIVPNQFLQQSGFIFVCQDVRGRWMSEGDYTTMTPNKEDPDKIDESSDAYGTIDWLVNNIPNNNGKVGQWGISYPGFYTSASLPDAHPALVASSPQAPVSDFFFDDFHHQGTYLLSYWYPTFLFGYQKPAPSDTAWYQPPNISSGDGYQFYKNNLQPLSKASEYYGKDNFFWQELVNHPNYDDFWQSRNILPHLKDIDHPILTVGGWFDAEDLYGVLNTYKSIEEQNPGTQNTLVMGPWSHGDWAGSQEHQIVGDIYFGDDISKFYKKNIEYPFFMNNLKDADMPAPPEAYMFDTGAKSWSKFSDWPPKNAQQKEWYLHGDQSLNDEKPTGKENEYSQYVSDLDNPVPYSEANSMVFTPRDYMTGDQRENARRPDVLTFETPPLDHEVTLSGEILAKLFVSTTGTASDFMVKLVDVYPKKKENGEYTPKGVTLSNYHQLVRSEAMRGRFRNSFENPEPFESGKITSVDVPLQDVYHTFKKGHKIQIEIQSTWFPLFDLNPQKYVPNIFKAKESDFQDATQRIYHSPEHPTSIEVKVLNN